MLNQKVKVPEDEDDDVLFEMPRLTLVRSVVAAFPMHAKVAFWADSRLAGLPGPPSITILGHSV